ncbi:hypothetical protein D0463_02105 [Bacillus sp. V59.32b]|nr:hypothetical protein D0463_02105 [Bacillus sp. V59.32b]
MNDVFLQKKYTSKNVMINDCAEVIIKSFFQYVFEKGLKVLAITKLHIHIVKNVKTKPIFILPLIKSEKALL